MIPCSKRKGLVKQLRCLVWQNRVDDLHADLAKDLRREVRACRPQDAKFWPLFRRLMAIMCC